MTEEKKSKGQNGENSLNSPKKGGRIMSTDEKEQKSITRREFVKGAAVGAAAAVGAGVLASCATPTPEVIEVTKEVIKEVPVTKEVIKEVIKEVPAVYEVLNPYGEIIALPISAIKPRVDTLEGKTIGLFDNGKLANPAVLGRLEELLKAKYPTAKFSWFRKADFAPSGQSPYEQIEWDQITAWAKTVDTVIATWAD